MTTQAATQFPDFATAVQQLVDEHRRLTDEPLLLAIYYKPEREPHDIFLFEVIENFGNNAISTDQELFEVTYSSTSGFPLEPGQNLHLVLTNPGEFETAVHEKWPLLEELRRAIKANDYLRLFCDPNHTNLLGMVDV